MNRRLIAYSAGTLALTIIGLLMVLVADNGITKLMGGHILLCPSMTVFLAIIHYTEAWIARGDNA
jgi:hypothetical protein